MSNTVIDPQVQDPSLDEGDNIAHIVKRNDANAGYIGQQEIEALCGKKWIPSKNPEGLPVCEECKEVLKRRTNRGEN